MKKLPKCVFHKKENKPNPYYVQKIYKCKRYHLGMFRTIEEAKKAIKEFEEDPETFIQFLEMNRKRDLPKNVQMNGKYFRAIKSHKAKVYDLGCFSNIKEAEQAIKDFEEDPEEFIQFLKMNRARDLPKGISKVKKNKKNPYYVQKMYKRKKYNIGYFPTLEAAKKALNDFNKRIIK